MRYLTNLFRLLFIYLICTVMSYAQVPNGHYKGTKNNDAYFVTQARTILYNRTPIIRLRSAINTDSGGTCQISPSEFHLEQSPREDNQCFSWDAFQVNCLAATNNNKMDLVFLLDDSGSMADDIDDMKREIIAFANNIQQNGIDANFALITFSDSLDLLTEFTPDPAVIQKQLDKIEVGGGYEMAMDSIVFALNNLQFRDDANRVFLCMTDEPSVIEEYTMVEVLQELDKNCGIVISVSVAFQSQPTDITPESTDMRLLALATGGAWIDIAELSFADVAFDAVNSIKARTWSYYSICTNDSCEQPPPGTYLSEYTDSDLGLLSSSFTFTQNNLMTVEEVTPFIYLDQASTIQITVSFPYEIGAFPFLTADDFAVYEQGAPLEVLSLDLMSSSSSKSQTNTNCAAYPLDKCTYRIVARTSNCSGGNEVVEGEVVFFSNGCHFQNSFTFEKPEFLNVPSASIATASGFPFREIIAYIETEVAYNNNVTRKNITIYDNGVEQNILEMNRLDDPNDPLTPPKFSIVYLVEDSQEDGSSRQACLRYNDSNGCESESCNIYTPEEIYGCSIYITEPRSGIYHSKETIDVSGYISCLGSLEPVPMEFLYVMDSSRSLRTSDPQDYRKIGALALLDSTNQSIKTKAGVIAFGDQSLITQPLTDDLTAVRNAINDLQQDGGTQMARAITQAVDHMNQSSNPSAYRFIILFSDGLPTNPQDALDEAQSSTIPINTIFLGESQQGLELLSEIASITGGTFFQAQDPTELPNAFLDYNRRSYIHQVIIETSANPNFKLIIPSEEIINGYWSAQRVPITPIPDALTTINATVQLLGNPSYQRSDSSYVTFGTPKGLIYIGM